MWRMMLMMMLPLVKTLTQVSRKPEAGHPTQIGDSCWVELLTKYSMFMELPNGCYVQISGLPAGFLYERLKNQGLLQRFVPQRNRRRLRRSFCADEDNQPLKKKQKRERLHSKRGASSVFAKEHVIMETDVFHRSKMFYASSTSEKIHPKCLISQLQASNNGARWLIQQALLMGSDLKSEFGNHCTSKFRRKVSGRLTKGMVNLLPLFKRFIAKFKKLDICRILSRHCPVQLKQGTTIPVDRDKVDNIGYLLSSFSSHYQVVTVVTTVCRVCVPTELWGSVHNWKFFCKTVSLLVKMKRYETLSVEQLMYKMKSSDCRWLETCCPGSKHFTPLAVSHRRQQLLTNWMSWLVNDFVLPLLKGYFYITESSVHRNRIFYFRKPLWKQISKLAFQMSLDSKFEELLPGQAQDARLLGKSLGVSYLRLLPKLSNIRAVVNMGRKQETGKASINKQLENAFYVIGFEKKRNRVMFGSSVFGVDDIYKIYAPFAARHRKDHLQKSLYFVTLDISGCFDNLDHKTLLGICQQLLREYEYEIRRYTTMTVSSSRLKLQLKRNAAELGSALFSDFATHLAESGQCHNTIFTDQVMYSLVQREQILQLLQAHITCNIVKAQGKHYRQTVGIPQGSVVSTMLCSLYIGAVENLFIQLSEDSVLMRMVDDFLLISYSLEEARNFIYSMQTGLEEFNCSLNVSKTFVNFDAGFECESILQDFFPWCGFCFNIHTLDVQVDYSRYEGNYLSDSLTVDSTNHPFLDMKRRLLLFLKGRIHPIYLDENFNSKAVVTCNVYQLSYLIAMKMLVYLRELPTRCYQCFSMKNFTDMLSEFSGQFVGVAQLKCYQVRYRG
ncbi:telomerase reverse transcriptase-like [Corticium candelabrum]|uniref:telomerase reverse transcriptase-like n=1 Tax=Corticium candelabrum TaxID=121492 RepID=UPI002E2684D4|nr:telomerase reverse transcriptase-like [Corticium candelabrum]